MAETRFSYEFIRDAMQSEGVRGELKKKADEMARRVNTLGDSEGVEMDAKVRELTRPKGRPEARVESEQVSQEWGNRTVKRRRIMGRAAEGA